ncbi:MAG: RNA polymerase sigma factor [Planctomycetes bacterium]|nr:RNA polymerase sigma factor [Planctomycetota bacterium]
MPTPTSKAERSDDALLLAIAKKRDREAFAELYARFERPAFNLARCLTGDAGLAEEAVQEGMLRVWQSAGNFQAGGNARGWVLKIVAREALRARGKAKRRDSMEIKDPLTEEAAGAAATRQSRDTTADGEVLDALRRHVAKLPDVQRQIVALYYGGGLTQEEIAQEMDLQQRAVSRRLHEALEALRGQLSKAGLTAAVPMLAVEGQGGGLFAALTQGEAVPAGLRERVLERVRDAGASAARETARAAAAKSGAGAMPLVLAAVVLLAAGGLYVAMQGGGTKKPPPAEAATTAEALKPGGLDVAWDFSEKSEGAFAALPCVFDWRSARLVPGKAPELPWVAPAPGVPGHLLATGDVTMELPVAIKAPNAEVFLYIHTPGETALIDLACLKPGEAPQLFPRESLWTGKVARTEDFKTFEGGGEKVPGFAEMRFVLLGEYQALYIGAKLSEILRMPVPASPVAPKRLALTLRGVGLVKGHVRELKPDEIPEDLRDVSAFIERLKKEGKGAAKK